MQGHVASGLAMLLHILIPVFSVRFDNGRASVKSCGASGISRNTGFYVASRAGCQGAGDHSGNIESNTNESRWLERCKQLLIHR